MPSDPTWAINRPYWAIRGTPSWSYPDDATANVQVPGTGENFIASDDVYRSLIANGIVPLIACAQEDLGSLPFEDRFNLWYWQVLIEQWGFGFAEELSRTAGNGEAGSLSSIILAALTELSE
jgi:hypothetical protein